jgi:hypothetical protein
MKKIPVVVLYVFFSGVIFGQARLNISSGGSVNFFFNSYQKYVTGITYNDFTQLTVEYNDTTAANIFPHWRIDVKSLNPNIVGDAGNTLDLDVIELSATGAGTSAGIQPLGISDVSLITGAVETGIGTSTVSVSYYCGVTKSLIGEEADYYVVDILFTLIGEN